MNKVILVVMDGIGIRKEKVGNAVYHAHTKNLDMLMKRYPNTLLNAHGTYVGLPSNQDMGNSEVGHNALGCGQIYPQGATLVDEAIRNKSLFHGSTWKKLVNYCKDHHTMHFIGLLSDGNVHSHINHLFTMLEEAKKEKIKRVRIHILLDGRDVGEVSALKYVDMLEEKLASLNDDDYDAKIASGGGRMTVTMDRYEANWKIVEKGWNAHVLGNARGFLTAKDAIETYRREEDAKDQYLDSFVVVDKKNNPIGKIMDGDSVIFFNFRCDRAIEISRAFDEGESFKYFDRVRTPNVIYAGMVQYDPDISIPKHFLVDPPKIKHTLTEQLCKYKVREYAISETQKYGHVTYYWNGNQLEKMNEELETYEEIPSDIIPFDQKPKMKSYEITDQFIEAIHSNQYDFLRCNFPNGDMVGHTGNYEKAIEAVEAVDDNLGRIMEEIKDDENTFLIVLADHGNAEEMYQTNQLENKVPKTSHTTNPVPFIIYGKNIDNIKIKKGDFSLANVAATVTTLLNIDANPNWLESIIKINKS